MLGQFFVLWPCFGRFHIFFLVSHSISSSISMGMRFEIERPFALILLIGSGLHWYPSYSCHINCVLVIDLFTYRNIGLAHEYINPWTKSSVIWPWWWMTIDISLRGAMGDVWGMWVGRLWELGINVNFVRMLLCVMCWEMVG